MNKTKLLIIDDEENVRNAIRQLVTNYCSNAIVVGEADSVKTGVSAIQQLHPDIVLLDVDIKDGSGFDLLGQFPEPAFGVIFITGYEEYAVKAFRFSALDFLLKPIDPDLLQSAIQKGSEHLAKYRLAQRFDSFLHNVNQLSKGNKKIAVNIKDKPVLIVQGSNDKLVRPEGTIDLFKRLATKDKKIVLIPDAEHLIFEEAQFKQKDIDTVVSWIQSHMKMQITNSTDKGDG